MIYSNAEMFFEDNVERREVFIDFHRKDDLKPSGDIFDELMKRNFIPGMSALIRLDALKQLGGFDEDLLYEDYDMWLRIAKSYQILYFDGVYVDYRMHEHNLHKSMQQDEAYIGSVFKMLLKYPENIIARERLLMLGQQYGKERIYFRTHVATLKSTLDKKEGEINSLKKVLKKEESKFISLKNTINQLIILVENIVSSKGYVVLFKMLSIVGRDKYLSSLNEQFENIKRRKV